MYELDVGSIRLAEALERAAQDPERLPLIADLLYYDREQLQQDIKAINDYIMEAK